MIFWNLTKKKKTVKSINLDDFSVEDLVDYLNDLKKEIKRTEDEIKKKNPACRKKTKEKIRCETHEKYFFFANKTTK